MRIRHGLLVLMCTASLAHANDFPTRARVDFVLACMRDSKAPPQESMYKCSCAIDVIADKVHYSDWVDLSTISNGITIAETAFSKTLFCETDLSCCSCSPSRWTEKNR